MLPFLNLTLIAVVFCHCWNNGDASSLLYEPPYTEPYVRWCGRTAEVTPPPTRLWSSFKSLLSLQSGRGQAGLKFNSLVHRSQGRVASGKLNQLCVTQTERAPADSKFTQFKVSARDVRGPTEELA